MEEKKKDSGKFKAVSPELIDLLMSVLIRIVGESVKDRIVRAVLIGILSAASSYVSIESPPDAIPAVVQK